MLRMSARKKSPWIFPHIPMMSPLGLPPADPKCHSPHPRRSFEQLPPWLSRAQQRGWKKIGVDFYIVWVIIYIYVYMYVYIIYIYVYIYICIYMYVYIYVCVYYIYIYVYIYMYVCVCNIYIYVFVCVHTNCYAVSKNYHGIHICQ